MLEDLFCSTGSIIKATVEFLQCKIVLLKDTRRYLFHSTVVFFKSFAIFIDIAIAYLLFSKFVCLLSIPSSKVTQSQSFSFVA
jgi:hypothetical protein